MKKKLKHLIEVFDIKKFIKFGMIGVLNTLVDFVVYTIAYFLICKATGYPMNAVGNPFWITAVAQAIAFMVAALNSFLLNKVWTFEKKNKVTKQEATRAVATNIGYYVVSLLLIRGVAALFHIPDTVAKLPATCCMILYNYLMNKFWVFK